MSLVGPLSAEMEPEILVRFKELIAPIIEHSNGETTLEQLLKDHKAGACEIWAIPCASAPSGVSSFLVTRVLVYPSGVRVLKIDHGAGNLVDAVENMPDIEFMARSLACDKMRIEGRFGWQRVFPDWKEVSRVIEKEL